MPFARIGDSSAVGYPVIFVPCGAGKMAEAIAIPVADKRWWGPRIWRILHCLAEISDRRDCAAGWRPVLLETAQMLPCDLCREHFIGAIRSLRLPGPETGKSPREAVRHMLWGTHAARGGTLPEEGLTAEYGYGGDRGAVVSEVRRLVDEVGGAFRREHVLDRFRTGHLEAWVRAVGQLAGLLANPEMIGSVGRRRR